MVLSKWHCITLVSIFWSPLRSTLAKTCRRSMLEIGSLAEATLGLHPASLISSTMFTNSSNSMWSTSLALWTEKYYYIMMLNKNSMTLSSGLMLNFMTVILIISTVNQCSKEFPHTGISIQPIHNPNPLIAVEFCRPYKWEMEKQVRVATMQCNKTFLFRKFFLQDIGQSQVQPCSDRYSRISQVQPSTVLNGNLGHLMAAYGNLWQLLATFPTFSI